jgi:hypothetical protein
MITGEPTASYSHKISQNTRQKRHNIYFQILNFRRKTGKQKLAKSIEREELKCSLEGEHGRKRMRHNTGLSKKILKPL